MRIGASLFLIAAGAVLRFAVTMHTWHHVNLWAGGVILMVVGALGLVLTVIFMLARRRTDIIQSGPGGTRGTTYVAPNDPMHASY